MNLTTTRQLSGVEQTTTLVGCSAKGVKLLETREHNKVAGNSLNIRRNSICSDDADVAAAAVTTSHVAVRLG